MPEEKKEFEEKKSSPSLYERKVETAKTTAKLLREIGADPTSERGQHIIRIMMQKVK